jgi:hypothetical protein
MHVEYRREIARRHPRKQADHSEHEALRPGDTDFSGHPLREALETVQRPPRGDS